MTRTPRTAAWNGGNVMQFRNGLSRFLRSAFVLGSTYAAAQSQPSATKAASLAAAPAGSTSGYNQPPKYILDVMHAQSPPSPNVSPTLNTILLVSWQDYPSIARVALPFLRLAGVRVEPKNHSKHDTPGGYGITPCATKFELVHVASSTAACASATSCSNALVHCDRGWA
jgi:hypothetical protein